MTTLQKLRWRAFPELRKTKTHPPEWLQKYEKQLLLATLDDLLNELGDSAACGMIKAYRQRIQEDK